MRVYPTRPALYRLSRIDREIASGHMPTAPSLARLIEVSARTIQRDIEFMRDSLGAPVTYDPVRHGYYYSESTYRLTAATLTEGEIVSILIGSKVLAQYAGTPFEADLTRAFAKIEQMLPDEVSVRLAELADAISFSVTCPRPTDLDLFRKLTRAVHERRELRMVYASLSSKRTSARVVDPYRMACVNGAWYLVAHCHTRREVRLFVPDRIRSVEETGAMFEVRAGFDFEKYMRGAFGVMRGGRPRRVRLRFTGMAAKYVPERKWHSTQNVKRRGDACELRMTVTGLDEVARWVMSFGGECEVLAPKELKARVIEGHEAGLARQRRQHSSGGKR